VSEPTESGGRDDRRFRHLGDDEGVALQRLRVVTGTFVAPDGSTFTRDVVRNKAVVAMVPLRDDGDTVVAVRQYRGPIDEEILEIPAGLCDVDGEPLETTAQRELAEEVGLEAGVLTRVAEFHPAAGFSDQHVSIYLATDLKEVPANRLGPEEQHMTVEEISLRDVPSMVADGTLTDAKTLIGLLVAREHLGLR
jgi:ADP-ribose pyrophosphatase